MVFALNFHESVLVRIRAMIFSASAVRLADSSRGTHPPFYNGGYKAAVQGFKARK